MAPDGELDMACPGTLPADFGDWDSGAPPATLPPDFEGFDSDAIGLSAAAAASVPAPLVHLASSEPDAARAEELGTVFNLECSKNPAEDFQEDCGAILSIPDAGGSSKRMTIIALGLILLLAAGVAIYYSFRGLSHRMTASPTHSSPNVFAQSSPSPTQAKVTEFDSADASTLKSASGAAVEVKARFVPVENEQAPLQNPSGRSRSNARASLAKRSGKAE